AVGIDGTILFYGKTILQALSEHGVPSVYFAQQAYSQGAYSRVSMQGSRTVSYLGASDLIVRLADELETARRPTFFYVYWDDVDTLGHVYSPYSRETAVEIESISRMLAEQLPSLLGPGGWKAADRTLLFVTADHGQMRVTPEKTIYLTDYPEVVRALRPKGSGEPILPTGSLRDVFLHL